MLLYSISHLLFFFSGDDHLTVRRWRRPTYVSRHVFCSVSRPTFPHPFSLVHFHSHVGVGWRRQALAKWKTADKVVVLIRFPSVEEQPKQILAKGYGILSKSTYSNFSFCPVPFFCKLYGHLLSRQTAAPDILTGWPVTAAQSTVRRTFHQLASVRQGFALEPLRPARSH